ncbi:MAG: hypothetical protein E7408_06480 [Ruminococcaceae bacterium]|nr:hypothetical protein [Oscillospiraceae bacterium]
MIKILVALIVIGGFWAIGQSRNARVAARLSGLWRILDGLQTMESEIRGICAPLPVAFEAAGRHSPLFQAAARYCDEESGEAAFCHAVAEGALEKPETEILHSFAAGLSAEEEMGQLRNIQHCHQRLSALCARLEKEAARMDKLYSSSGILAGILVVILLF